MRKNLFSISSKLALLALGLLIFKAQAATPQPLTPSSFTYPANSKTVTFNSGWTYTPGDTLFFTPALPSGLSDVVIVLSATQDQTGNVYKLAIGRDGGVRASLVYKSDYSTFLSDDSILVGTSYQGKGNADIAYNLVSGQTYWVQYLASDASLSTPLPTLALGTGNVAGQNVVCKWKITNPIVPTPQYIGFGGWSNEVDFTNISVIRAVVPQVATPSSISSTIISVIRAVVPQVATPSSSSYTSGGYLDYHNQAWKTGLTGAGSNFCLTFQAVTTGNFYVGFATSAGYNSGGMVYYGNYGSQTINFGSNGVTLSGTYVTYSSESTPCTNFTWFLVNIAVSDACYVDVYGASSPITDTEHATHLLSASYSIGMMPAYVGFGGDTTAVAFTGINISPTTPAANITLNIPDGFIAISGNFKRISVGSAKDGLEVWATDGSGQLFRFDPSQSNPWTAQALKDDANNVIPSLVDVAVSSLDNMVAIRGDDKTAIEYDWTKKVWKKLPASNAATIKLAQISIANSSHIYAVSEDKIIYNHTAASKDGKTAASWKKISDGIYVATGLSTAKAVIVIGVSESGSAYEFVNKKWIPLTGATNIDEVAIGNEKHIFGVGKDGSLWHLDYKTKKWVQLTDKDKKQASGFGSISVNAAGTIFALDGEGDVYNKGNAGVTVKTSASGTTTLVASSDQKQAPAKVVTKKTVKKKVAKK